MSVTQKFDRLVSISLSAPIFAIQQVQPVRRVSFVLVKLNLGVRDRDVSVFVGNTLVCHSLPLSDECLRIEDHVHVLTTFIPAALWEIADNASAADEVE